MKKLHWGQGLFRWMRWFALACLFAGAASSALATKTYTDNGDGTMTDPTTGLQWMRCSMGQTWSGSACNAIIASTYTWDQAMALTNTVTFAGQSDWRLPNIRELETIADRQRWFPAIDPVAFPDTPSSTFLSSSTSAPNLDGAWVVGFTGGETGTWAKSEKASVRLVRGGQPSTLLTEARPSSDYVDHGDGTVTHTPTDLSWKRCVEGKTWTGVACTGSEDTMTWETANAVTSTFAGKSDWRLPTVDELGSLIDYTLVFAPAINSTLFKSTPSLGFWSSSLYGNGGNSAWSVSFFIYPTTGSYIYSGYHAVRMVRGGKPLNLVTLSLTKSGAGTGTVTDIPPLLDTAPPPTINCGVICSHSYVSGTSVTLFANPAAGSTFTGWSGACSGTGSCVVNMNAEQSVTANFALAPRLINLSTRGHVQTGDNVMIGGFIIQGDSPQTVLIRAVGPNLANYGVTGVLADPMLELRRSSDGAIIASNDNWGDAANAAAIQATGLAPVDAKESAILTTLQPGAYTAIVSGSGGGTGVGIVEVYAQ